MSNEPRRLLDDPEISDSLRSDLGRVRDAEVDYDAKVGLSRLQAAIGAPGSGAGDSGTSTGTGTTTSIATGKLATIGIAAVAAIATGYFLLKPPTVPTQPTPVIESPSAVPIPSAAPPADSNEEIPTLSLSALPSEPSAKPGAEIPAPAASVSPEERLRAEMKQLAEVRSALASSPARALELANQGNRDFKGGVFYQEREALAISAMVRLGQTAAAKARAENFLKAYPRGPYSERVRQETGLQQP